MDARQSLTYTVSTDKSSPLLDTDPSVDAERISFFDSSSSSSRVSPSPSSIDRVEQPTSRYSSHISHSTSQTYRNETTQHDSKMRDIERRPKHKPSRSCTSPNPLWSLQVWWIEISACIVAIVTIFAIIATLYPHQGKPLPQWPYQLSVNTLLSIYTAVLKGAVIKVISESLGQLKWRWFRRDRPLNDLVTFDEATRGPLGSLNLLWLLRFRDGLSSAGALIALLVLAIDPFTQQLVRYYSCSVPASDMQALIPRTNVLALGPRQVDPLNVLSRPRMHAAFIGGVKNPGDSVSPICPSGNCTFLREYSSLGFCSACKDISGEMKFRDTNLVVKSSVAQSYSGALQHISIADVLKPQEINSTGQYKNISVSAASFLPSNLSLTTNPGPEFNLSTMKTVNSTGPSTSYDVYDIEILVGKQWRAFSPLTGEPPTDCQTYSMTKNWRYKGFGAASCTLAPCVRTYNASINAGKFNERLLASSKHSSGSWGTTLEARKNGVYMPYLGMVDKLCLSEEEHQHLINAGYDLDAQGRWLAYNLTFDPVFPNNNYSSTPLQSLMTNKCLYAIPSLSYWGEHLAKFFEGTVTGVADESGVIDSLAGPQVLQDIYNYGDVSLERVESIVQNISNSLTTYIRQNSQPKYSQPAEGIVLQAQTCLSVRWSWLAFPTILAILNLLILLGALIRSRPASDGIPVWKSSPLALIYHGLVTRNQERADVSDQKGMSKLAKETLVRLADTGEAVRFVDPKHALDKAG